ncbi:MAG: hypothetical protein WBQ73_04305 [Candidatus Babeliales bacterium]
MMRFIVNKLYSYCAEVAPLYWYSMTAFLVLSYLFLWHHFCYQRLRSNVNFYQQRLLYHEAQERAWQVAVQKHENVMMLVTALKTRLEEAYKGLGELTKVPLIIDHCMQEVRLSGVALTEMSFHEQNYTDKEKIELHAMTYEPILLHCTVSGTLEQVKQYCDRLMHAPFLVIIDSLTLSQEKRVCICSMVIKILAQKNPSTFIQS